MEELKRLTESVCRIAREAFIGKWDFSAAALMVLEAGDRITDFDGNDDFLDGHHIIATNGPLHPLFLKLVDEVPPSFFNTVQ